MDACFHLNFGPLYQGAAIAKVCNIIAAIAATPVLPLPSKTTFNPNPKPNLQT